MTVPKIHPRRRSYFIAVISGSLLITGLGRTVAQENERSGGYVLAIQQAVVQAIDRADGSLVAIAEQEAPLPSPARTRVRGLPPLEVSGLGFSSFVGRTELATGVVIDSAGYILTHFSTVANGRSLEVITQKGQRLAAKVVGADERSGLAVLKVRGSGLPTIAWGNADTVRRGEFVVSLGQPYLIVQGQAPAASWGIVSSRPSRLPTTESAEGSLLTDFGWLLQTDARLRFGTSGGVIINLKGEMIGLTTNLPWIAGFDAAATYAIPVDDALRRIVGALRRGEEVEYGFLGAYLFENFEAEIYRGADSEKNNGSPPRGITIRAVIPGSPADRANLRSLDTILAVNDEPVETSDQLMLRVSTHGPDERLKLRVDRDGKQSDMELQLAKAAPWGRRIVTAPPQLWRGIQVDYATASDDFAQKVRVGAIDKAGCVLVRDVEPESPCWQAGLRPGDFITHVDGDRVETPDEFYEQVPRQAETVRIRMRRDDADSKRIEIPSQS